LAGISITAPSSQIILTILLAYVVNAGALFSSAAPIIHEIKTYFVVLLGFLSKWLSSLGRSLGGQHSQYSRTPGCRYLAASSAQK